MSVPDFGDLMDALIAMLFLAPPTPTCALPSPPAFSSAY